MRNADNLPPSCAVVTKSGNINFLETSGPFQACNGTALPLPLPLFLVMFILFGVGVRFSTLVQIDPGAHPATYTMGTGSFPGVKRSERGVDHPSLSSAEVKESVQL